jgi:hypothetical protein
VDSGTRETLLTSPLPVDGYIPSAEWVTKYEPEAVGNYFDARLAARP